MVLSFNVMFILYQRFHSHTILLESKFRFHACLIPRSVCVIMISLGLSQQQIATLISIQIRQYQRLEYGESDVQKLGMRAGLSLCIVLELDPYDLIFGAHPEALEDIRNRRPSKGNLKVRHKS